MIQTHVSMPEFHDRRHHKLIKDGFEVVLQNIPHDHWFVSVVRLTDKITHPSASILSSRVKSK
jgi:hypothetical protein